MCVCHWRHKGGRVTELIAAFETAANFQARFVQCATVGFAIKRWLDFTLSFSEGTNLKCAPEIHVTSYHGPFLRECRWNADSLDGGQQDERVDGLMSVASLSCACQTFDLTVRRFIRLPWTSCQVAHIAHVTRNVACHPSALSATMRAFHSVCGPSAPSQHSIQKVSTLSPEWGIASRWIWMTVLR